MTGRGGEGPQLRSAAAGGTALPAVQILLRAELADIATALHLPTTPEGGGWARILAAGAEVACPRHVLDQAARAGLRDDPLPIADEAEWVAWLRETTADASRAGGARLAMDEVAHAISLNALPRPLPDALIGTPGLVLRIDPGWLDRLAADFPASLRVFTDVREVLSRRLGIPVPALSVRPEPLPARVFGLAIGALDLPLQALTPWQSEYQPLEWIAWGVAAQIRRWAEALVDADVVSAMLDMLEPDIPGTVRLVRALVPGDRLLSALRVLLAHRVPLASLAQVLDRLLDAAYEQVSDADLPAFLRAGLGRPIAAAAPGAPRAVRAYVLGDGSSPTKELFSDDELSGQDAWVDSALVVEAGRALEAREATRVRYPDLLVIARDEVPVTSRLDDLATVPRAAPPRAGVDR